MNLTQSNRFWGGEKKAKLFQKRISHPDTSPGQIPNQQPMGLEALYLNLILDISVQKIQNYKDKLKKENNKL